MLASTFIRGIRLNAWNTNPILRLRTSASCPSSSDPASMPSMKYCPLVGTSRQPMMFIIVDLPDPDMPMIAR